MGDAEKFWSDFEAQTGEKVVAKAMGIWEENGNDKGLWGILILTDKSFRFRHIPSEGLILGLFRLPEGKREKREPVEIVAPLDSISSVRGEERNWLSRLFGSPFRRFEVAWRASPDEEPRREGFSVDPSLDFLKKLRAALPGLADR